MHGNDPSSGLITRAVPSGPGFEEATRIFVERVYFEDEVTPFGWLAKRRLSAVSLSETTGGRLERALRYRELMVPLGFRHEARGVFALDGEMWGRISANREPDSPDFNTRELAFFRRIAPHLAAGLKAATLHSKALAEPADEDTVIPGVLVLDHKGRVAQHPWLRSGGSKSLRTSTPGGKKATVCLQRFYRW